LVGNGFKAFSIYVTARIAIKKRRVQWHKTVLYYMRQNHFLETYPNQTKANNCNRLPIVMG
jgi:hypothetical protein